MKTIFITIPSYEDPQLMETIDSAISKASYPKNIFFGVGLQYKKVKAPDMGKYFRNPNVRYTYYNVDTRPGVNQVRHDLLKFYNGQDYYLMIDAHTPFMDNWDELLIKEHEAICSDTGGNKVIISQLVNSADFICTCYGSLGTCKQKHKVDRYSKENLNVFPRNYGPALSRVSRYTVMEDPKDNKPYHLSGAAAAGFFFAPGSWVEEVGILDGIESAAEELLLSYTSYIMGWDIYGLKSINPVGHDNRQYNLLMYGDEYATNKSYTRVSDSPETSMDIERLLVLNTGRFSKNNAVRSPEDFWKMSGLLEEFYIARDRLYEAGKADIVEYAMPTSK